MARDHWSELVWASEHDRTALSRAAKRGTLRRMAPGLYTAASDPDLAIVARRHLLTIVAHELPGAVIADRSASVGGLPVGDELFVVHRRGRPLILPGVTIMPRAGPGPLDGDMSLPEGLYLASEARMLLESLSRPGGRRLTRDDVERRIDRLCATGGASRLNSIRDLAASIAPPLRATAPLKVLLGLIAASLNTGDVASVRTPALVARARGQAYDRDRLTLFEQMVGRLSARAPGGVVALADQGDRRATLPFYEAYFSNFIEGTEFTLAEAERLVLHGEIPSGRPADARDITATYAIVADPTRRGVVPANQNEFIDLLGSRHGEVLAGRPDKRPGRFKHLGNRAGSTEFVAPDLVEGTLRSAFDAAAPLADPFQRAAYMMFVIAEVHPFLDGNGRVARIAMNAELSAGGFVRIIIPTVMRLNYVASLKAATIHGSFDALIAVLDFAQRYTARVDFSTLPSAKAVLTSTNAFCDPYEAEQSGVRLQLP